MLLLCILSTWTMVPVLCSGFHLAEPATARFLQQSAPRHRGSLRWSTHFPLCVRSVIHTRCAAWRTHSDLEIENHLLLLVSYTDSVGVASCTGLVELWGNNELSQRVVCRLLAGFVQFRMHCTCALTRSDSAICCRRAVARAAVSVSARGMSLCRNAPLFPPCTPCHQRLVLP